MWKWSSIFVSQYKFKNNIWGTLSKSTDIFINLWIYFTINGFLTKKYLSKVGYGCRLT